MANKASKKVAAKKTKKLPRQNALPGMADAKITTIENLAMDYVELRDERQAVGIQEVELKQKLIAAMHKAGKTEYKRGGISVTLKVEKEGIKVRVRDEDETTQKKAASPAEDEPEVAEEDSGESEDVLVESEDEAELVQE